MENRAHFNNEMFHGFDFDGTMLRIGSMNMMLHGIQDPKIEAKDSLSEKSGYVDEAFSLILANPPFKGSIEKSTIAKDLSKVIALFLRLLKVGGRAALIVPDGVLFGSSKAHKTIRKTLVEDHKLDGVISMPSGVFKPYAGVSTAILIFTKTGVGGTDYVWFYDMEADGFSLDDNRQKIEKNDIPDIIKCWKERELLLNSLEKSPLTPLSKEGDRKGKAFFVPKDEIKYNGYDLSINRYKEIEYEEVEYDPPSIILGKLRNLEADIDQDLTELERLLS